MRCQSRNCLFWLYQNSKLEQNVFKCINLQEISRKPKSENLSSSCPTWARKLMKPNEAGNQKILEHGPETRIFTKHVLEKQKISGLHPINRKTFMLDNILRPQFTAAWLFQTKLFLLTFPVLLNKVRALHIHFVTLLYFCLKQKIFQNFTSSLHLMLNYVI